MKNIFEAEKITDAERPEPDIEGKKELTEKEQAILEEVKKESEIIEKVPTGEKSGKWEKTKKAMAIALLGATIFAGSMAGNVETAEAGGRNYKNPVMERIEKDAARGFGRGVERAIDNLFRRGGVISEGEMRQDRSDVRNMQKRVWQEQFDQVRRQARDIERMENDALKEYNQDVRQAKTEQDLQMAKKKLDLKMEQVRIYKQGGSSEQMIQRDEQKRQNEQGESPVQKNQGEQSRNEQRGSGMRL